MKLKNIIGHTKTILIHKWWVFYYCCKCGIPWRGLIHDSSKFSPIEFFEGVKYYTPGKSPIPVAKKAQGYSKAWLHHRGHNKHHCEYWTDNYSSGMTCVRMPFKYAVEKLCDHLGASRTYCGPESVFVNAYDWWMSEGVNSKLHPDTRSFFSVVFKELSTGKGESLLNKKKLLNTYIDTFSEADINMKDFYSRAKL